MLGILYNNEIIVIKGGGIKGILSKSKINTFISRFSTNSVNRVF